jgi:mannose-1-phosphate guanylyltransferase/phosphomannomutase
MKAVVMAGGEGTRLRPLTSNQPKPMVSVVGKPCMEHILDLLLRHGFEDVIVTLAFLPQAIKSHFGDGESLGMSIEYSLEETPMGTAGSVRLATTRLDDTFIVISGDALTDFDLDKVVEFHRERESAATIALKSVPNPLEFGIVVTDEEGRVERFLEKPSWGQVFSDTINTGIYVLEPEVLTHIPDDRPFDFSKELFPLLLEMGKPLFGFACDGYWQDIGNLDQYRQANADALDEHVRLDVPGIRLRGNIWLGEGVEIDDLEGVEGPAFIGSYSSISPEATVGAYSVLGANVRLRERSRVVRSVLDTSTFVGRNAVIEGAVVGRSCDIRSYVHVHDGVALGDGVILGAQAVVMPDVRIFPHKEVESGAVVHESLIWESAAATHVFGKEGVSGIVNVDLTPEVTVRLAAALGTALQRGGRVVASRDATAACRMIKRAMVSGLTSTGISVADLRVLPAPVNRHLLRTQGHDAGFHVGVSPVDPEMLQIRFYEHPGIQLTPTLQKEIEKHYTRFELRRVAPAQIGKIGYPVRVRESYAQDLLDTLKIDVIKQRGFRILVDYGESAASFVLPLVLGPLGVETVSVHEFAEASDGEPQTIADVVEQSRRLVRAVGADLGAVFDRSGERLRLIDEEGHALSPDQTTLLYLALLARSGKPGAVAFPGTTTSAVERLVDGAPLEVVRTGSSLAALTQAADGDGFVFAAAENGSYIVPTFQPAADAMAALCLLLELLAPESTPLSTLVADLPASFVVHEEVPCPWARKGVAMRILTERFKDRDLDLSEGIKMYDGRGWACVLPDAVEPVLHIYAEGRAPEQSEEIERELHEIVVDAVEQETEAGAPISS